MALNERKGVHKTTKIWIRLFVIHKLVDSQIELSSSEFWFCFVVKLTGYFAYFVVSANLSKHTMHHQPKLGSVYLVKGLKN